MRPSRRKGEPSADARVLAIASRIQRAVGEGRRTEDDEIKLLLKAMVRDERRAYLITRLLDTIEDIYGIGDNGQADEIFDLLVTYCEAAADFSQIRSSTAEEAKTGTWGPIVLAGLMGTTGAGLQFVAAETVERGIVMAVVAGIITITAAAWGMRQGGHAAMVDADATRLGMEALVRAIERRSSRGRGRERRQQDDQGLS